MVDYTLITSAISSLKAATEIATLIKESGFLLEKAENKLKIAELLYALADANIKLAEIQQSMLEKDSVIKELKNQIEIKEKLNWDSPFYWLEESGNKDGPFCQQCYDKDNKLIRLQMLEVGSWECKVCKNNFFPKDYDPPDSWYAD